MWEAFARASLGVRQYYRQKGQLTVEKPVLDDTGDGIGKDAGATGPDGAIASRTFFDDADDPARAGGPALSELVARRNALESELDELKKRKDFMRLAGVREAARRGDHRDRPRVAEDPHRAPSSRPSRDVVAAARAERSLDAA